MRALPDNLILVFQQPVRINLERRAERAALLSVHCNQACDPQEEDAMHYRLPSLKDKNKDTSIMRKAALSIFLAITVLAPLPASANAGVPMLMVFLPPLWLSLIPVIAIEAWILTRLLEMRAIRSVVAVALGNAASSIVGIPLMWTILATIQGAFAGGALGLDTIGKKIYAVTIQAPWLIPYEEDLGWMIPIALLVLSVPAYLLSVLVEWQIIRRFIAPIQLPKGLRAVAIANFVSYIGLALLFVALAVAGDRANPLFRLFDGVTGWILEIVFRGADLLMGTK